MAKAPQTPESVAPTVAAPAATVISPFGRKPLRTFALVIGLPAFLLYVLSAVLVIAALAVMGS